MADYVTMVCGCVIEAGVGIVRVDSARMVAPCAEHGGPREVADQLDVAERDHTWVDNEGVRWRWCDGWQWWMEGESTRWITSNRPRITDARGPFTRLPS